jgi:NAD+ diphosphatase
MLGSAHGLDRLAERRGDAEYLTSLEASPHARFTVLVADAPMLNWTSDRTAARIRWFQRHEIVTLAAITEPPLFLGITRDTGHARFAVAANAEHIEANPMLAEACLGLMPLIGGAALPFDDSSILGQAKSLADWHRTHCFCGACGAPSHAADGGWRRICTQCGRSTYPRTDPVVIMLITNAASDQCLISREPRFPDKMYSIPAGYIEPGENIEHAAVRETLEETGLHVSRVTYSRSQPWPFPHTLMIGCRAVAEAGPITHDPLELDEARWASRAEIASLLDGTHPSGFWLPGAHAIAHALIAEWMAETADS